VSSFDATASTAAAVPPHLENSRLELASILGPAKTAAELPWPQKSDSPRIGQGRQALGTGPALTPFANHARSDRVLDRRLAKSPALVAFLLMPVTSSHARARDFPGVVSPTLTPLRMTVAACAEGAELPPGLAIASSDSVSRCSFAVYVEAAPGNTSRR